MTDNDGVSSEFSRLMRTAGTPEGARERTRLSYDQHLRLALARSGGAGDTPHSAALYGALGTWYKVRGMGVVEPLIWGELAPFLLISPDDTAREALAEYTLYLEECEGWWGEVPVGTKVTWLRDLINDALRKAASPNPFAVVGVMNGVSWCNLLESDVREPLDREAAKLREAVERETQE